MSFITVMVSANKVVGKNFKDTFQGHIQICGIPKSEIEVMTMMEAGLTRPTLTEHEVKSGVVESKNQLEMPFTIPCPFSTDSNSIEVKRALGTILDKCMSTLNLLNKHLGYKVVTANHEIANHNGRTYYYWTLQN